MFIPFATSARIPLRSIAAGATSALLLAALTGCSGFTATAPTEVSPQTAPVAGSVHGGQQPVTGSHIYLFEIGTGGYFNASTNIVSATGSAGSDTYGNYVTTDASGNFSLVNYTCNNGADQTYLLAVGGNPGLPGNVNNTAITTLASIGTCANVANLSFAAINEVTTAATITAFQQFMADFTHVGTSSTNTQGVNTAASLVQDLTAIATGSATATNLAGTGTGAQAKLNTLGNVLAPCINSAGPSSSDCQALFSAATPAGGTAPTTVANAMLNIAQNPTNNVAALYVLPNAAAPFQPTLSAVPNDFALSLTYTGGGLASPQNIVIDSAGSAWVADCPSCTGVTGTDKIVGINLAGVFQSGTGGYTTGIHKPQGLAFDNAGNLWSTNDKTGTTPDQVIKMTGSAIDFALSDTNIATPLGIAIDATNNAWVSNQTFAGIAVKVSPAGADIATASDPGNTYFPTGIGIDPSGAIYMAGTGSGTILKFKSTGTITYDSSNGVTQPLGISIDSSGNVFTINNDSSMLTKLFGASGNPAYDNAVFISNAYQVSVDGLSNAWIADCPGQGCGANAGNLLHVSNAGTIIGSGNGLQDPHLSDPTASAIDATGNVWVTNSLGASITEFIGVAAPVKTPLAVATFTGFLGARP